MGSGRTISQEAFEALVKENMEDLGMDPEEALEDSIQTLTLQGVDLSGIVKCIPGVTSAKDNPVLLILDELKNVSAGLDGASLPTSDQEEMLEILERLYNLCSVEGSDNAVIAMRNGGVELLTSLCSGLGVKGEQSLVTALKALGAILKDVQSTEAFRNSGGPLIILDILRRNSQNIKLLDSAFSVVADAATGNEIVKESFMDLHIDEILLENIREHCKAPIESLYSAIRVLLTPDDNRVLASQVYGYARRFAQIGIADALVDALHEGLSLTSLLSVCIALKAVAVNDEICRSISEKGGIDAVLKCIVEIGTQNNKAVARACCSLLAKLAGSDTIKSIIIQKGGLDKLIELSSRFSGEPSVLQEVMLIMCTLSLRSPENAARAVEAGAGDLAIQAMQKFPVAYPMQKQSCLMIRNLVARNPENRTILLNGGIEKLIRRAKGSHESCKDAATAALRDLGLDDYNS